MSQVVYYLIRSQEKDRRTVVLLNLGAHDKPVVPVYTASEQAGAAAEVFEPGARVEMTTMEVVKTCCRDYGWTVRLNLDPAEAGQELSPKIERDGEITSIWPFLYQGEPAGRYATCLTVRRNREGEPVIDGLGGNVWTLETARKINRALELAIEAAERLAE